MSSLNGYDKQHISFLIPVGNTKQTFLAAVPVWTLIKKTQNTDMQLLDDLGCVQLKVLKSFLRQIGDVVLCGQVLALQWVIMDKQSSDGSCSFMQTGFGMGAVIKCNDKHKHKNPPYVSLSASF